MDITRTSGKRVNAGQGELVTAGGNQTTVRKSWKTLAAVVLGLVLSIPGLAKAQFDFTTIDVPGSTSTAANGNSTHEIAGEYVDADGKTHGFVLSKGVFTTIDVLGAGLLLASTESTRPASSLELTHYGDQAEPRLFLEQGRCHHTRPGRVDPNRKAASSTRRARSSEVTGMQTQKRHGFIWSKGIFTTFNVTDATPTAWDRWP